MLIVVPGLLETMIKQKKLFSIGLPKLGRPMENNFFCFISGHLNISPPLPDIERVRLATLLGIDVSSTLSTSV